MAWAHCRKLLVHWHKDTLCLWKTSHSVLFHKAHSPSCAVDLSVSKRSSSMKGHSSNIRRKLITFPLFLSHTNIIVRSIKKRKVVAHAYNFTAYIASVTWINSLIEIIFSPGNTIFLFEYNLLFCWTHQEQFHHVYLLSVRKNQRSEIGYLTSLSFSCPWRFLSATQSFDNSWSNSRFEIQRLKYTYSIWREQMMCAASVTFKICFISANKTLEQSRVSGVICSALFCHLCSESQSLFKWTLDSLQSECDCENTFTLFQLSISRVCQLCSKKSCYFAGKELQNKRGTAGWWELLVFNHEMNGHVGFCCRNSTCQCDPWSFGAINAWECHCWPFMCSNCYPIDKISRGS